MERRTALVELSQPQVQAALQHALGDVTVLAHELIPTGRANTNYLVTTPERQLVLRLHVRQPEACAKERALYRLLADSVPLAPLLASHEATDVIGHAFSVLGFVGGQTLERAVQGGAELRLETAARSLSDVLARLTQFRFDTFGDLGADAGADKLRVSPWSFSDFYRLILFESPAAARLGTLRDSVWRLVQNAGERFPDAWPPHLAHGDFNPTNILVDDSGEVSAVLDWEFAHAGNIWADLGNLLRTRSECPLPPYFVPALLEGLSDLGLNLPENWNDLRLLADLSSACDFLSSAEERPETHARALKQVQQTLRLLLP